MYEARHITHRFGSVTALQDVSIRILPGQIHALLGANGAGKSTMMKVLAGAQQPTEGSLQLDGQPAHFPVTSAAADRGIAWVAQELTIFPQLDVLENLFLTREPRRGPIISRKDMRDRARPFLEMVGLKVNLSSPLALLRLGERQRVEICRALIRQPRILILDEPTSALDAEETRRLLEVVRGLRDSGVGVVLVSHFLEDVFAVADTITVLRDGRTVLEAVPKADLNPRKAIEAMLGAAPAAHHPPVTQNPVQGRSPETDQQQRGLSLRGVTVRGVIDPLDLDVMPGQIVGLAGLEGSGAHALLEVLYGHLRVDAGNIQLPDGQPGPRSITAAVRAGIAFIPSDRGRVGLFGDQSVRENIAVVRALAQTVDRLLLKPSVAESRAAQRVSQLQIRPGRTDLPVHALSGGNQQKVVFAKWLEAGPSIYLLDDPTRGVDVGTRAQMHDVIREFAAAGAIVLIVSSDLDELCDLVDRAVIFFHGNAVGQMNADELTTHRLLEAINTGALPTPSAVR